VLLVGQYSVPIDSQILWRDKTVGDLVREMRAVDAEEAG
jgi:hypothetical protein